MKNGKKIGRAMPGYDFGQTDSGNEFVQVTFMIHEGPEAGETIGWRGFFTDKTTDRTLESLRHCGWAGNDVTDLTGIDRNLVELVVENETYEGKTYPRVKWVNRLGGGVPAKNQMSPEARAKFAARMKGAAMAVPTSIADEGVRYDPSKAPAASNGKASDDGDPGWDDTKFPF